MPRWRSVGLVLASVEVARGQADDLMPIVGHPKLEPGVASGAAPGGWVSFKGGDHQVLAFVGTSVRMNSAVFVSFLRSMLRFSR